MIRLVLTDRDFRNILLRYSPIMELVLSFRLLLQGKDHPVYHKWIVRQRQSFDLQRYPLLQSLILPFGYVPDFLTPSSPDIKNIQHATELVQQTETTRFQRDIEKIISIDPSRAKTFRSLIAKPQVAKSRIRDELNNYWNNHLLAYWSQISAVINSEIHRRSYQAASHGWEKVFATLNMGVKYRQNNLCVAKKHQFTASLSGSGITLVPLFFSDIEPLVLCDVPGAYTIFFPATHNDVFACNKMTRSFTGLQLLFGPIRTCILKLLWEYPLTTTLLSSKMRVSPGAISQHLSILHNAGLVAMHKDGRYVYYFLTENGIAAVNLFEKNY